MTRACVIGIGNADRGDDAAGLIAARSVRAAGLPGVTVHEMNAEPHALMEAWRGYSAVCLVDACAALGQPGRIHRFDAGDAPLPERLGAMSSHGFGLGTTIELARALGALPPQLIVFAIEADNFEPGAAVSPAIDAAARAVAERVRQDLAALPVG